MADQDDIDAKVSTEASKDEQLKEAAAEPSTSTQQPAENELSGQLTDNASSQPQPENKDEQYNEPTTTITKPLYPFMAPVERDQLSREKPIPSDQKPNIALANSHPEPKFENLEEALRDRLFQLEKRLTLNEDLMMTYLFREDICESYYNLWLHDSAQYFRATCATRRRLLRKIKQTS